MKVDSGAMINCRGNSAPITSHLPWGGRDCPWLLYSSQLRLPLSSTRKVDLGKLSENESVKTDEGKIVEGCNLMLIANVPQIFNVKWMWLVINGEYEYKVQSSNTVSLSAITIQFCKGIPNYRMPAEEWCSLTQIGVFLSKQFSMARRKYLVSTMLHL